MTDQFDFEAGLAQRLRARADVANRPFDAAAIAQATVTAAERRPLGRRLVWPTLRPGLVLLILAALLTIALLAVALAGALHINPLRPPTFPIATANGWIAVSANPKDVGGGENGDIYRVADGVPTRMISGSAGDGVAQACPSFSPDGARLAYGEALATVQPVTSFRGNWPVLNRAIVVVAVDAVGNVSAPISRAVVAPAAGPIACPEWSPDGRSVAVRLENELRIIDAASAAATVVPLAAVGSVRPDIAWSRDGSRIAAAEPGQFRLVAMNGRPSAVFPVSGTPTSMGWTAGDRQIAYVATDASGNRPTLRLLDLATRADSQLSVDPTDPQVALDISRAVVSPDGAQVAWVEGSRRCTADTCVGLPPRVMTKRLDGSPAIELPIQAGFLSGIQWSPAGDRLLLSSIDGLVSVGLPPDTRVVVVSRGDLNLEWSYDEVTWQPVFQ